ncbi:MAG: NAD-dependent epimerase/dehydratase family protein [Rhodocyclaceae bacterium]|nr:NAD-dependent epimerase/dehydratase family protein [Rhodocyclaceae bacterium]
MLAFLPCRWRVTAFVREGPQVARLRAAGVRVLVGDLDQRATLDRLAGVADRIVYSAPPASDADGDARLRRTLAALGGRSVARRLVYISTSGVYGDHGGAAVPETAQQRAASPRARRRVAAEQLLRDWGRRLGVATAILRAPGIYAADRLPLARLRAGTPAIRADEDSWSNHIHADDLARACLLALLRGRGGRAFNLCDDQPLRMGDYFDAVADHFGLPRPPRLPREAVRSRVEPMLWSFMAESRRLDNRRARRELRLRLRHPTVASFLETIDGQARDPRD